MDRILNFITAEFFPRIADDGIYAVRMVIRLLLRRSDRS